MKSLIKLFLLVVAIINSAHAMDGKNGVVDLRTLWIDCPHNKQDQNGNTFLHNLAHESAKMGYLSELDAKYASFQQTYKDMGVLNPIQNPFILNNEKRTARQEAKIVFNTSYNPVTKAFIRSLRMAEKSFASAVIESKERREFMDIGQRVQEQDEMYKRS